MGLVGLAHVLVNTCTRQTPAVCDISPAELSLVPSGGRRAAFPPASVFSWGQEPTPRHTRQHPSSHLQDRINNTNTIQYCRKWCLTSSLTSCVPPVGLFPAAFDKEMCDVCFQVFSGLDKHGAATRRRHARKATNSCFMIIYSTMKCCWTGQFAGQITLINGNVGYRSRLANIYSGSCSFAPSVMRFMQSNRV